MTQVTKAMSVIWLSRGCFFRVVVSGSADVVGVWRGLIGPPDVDLAKEESPASLRAKFGSSMVMNAVHGEPR